MHLRLAFLMRMIRVGGCFCSPVMVVTAPQIAGVPARQRQRFMGWANARAIAERAAGRHNAAARLFDLAIAAR